MQRMAGQAKGVTDFLGIKPDYAAQGNEAIMGDANEFAMRSEANAMVSNAGLKAQADILSAQHYADASATAANASAQSSMIGGIAGGLGGLAGGIGKAGFSYGQTKLGAGGGVVGGIGTLGPNYGIPQ
jgi:hypothetical protein